MLVQRDSLCTIKTTDKTHEVGIHRKLKIALTCPYIVLSILLSFGFEVAFLSDSTSATLQQKGKMNIKKEGTVGY